MATRQHLLQQPGGSVGAGTSYFNLLGLSTIPTASGTRTDRINRWPSAGVLANLRVLMSAAAGAGQTAQFTIMNGASPTAIDFTISGASDATGFSNQQATIAANDDISLRIIKSGGAASSRVGWDLTFTSSEGNGIAVYGNHGDLNTGSQVFGLFFGSQWNYARRSYVATPGTVTKMRYEITAAPGVGKSWEFCLVKNGTAQDGSGGTTDTRVTLTGTGSGAGITTGIWTGSVSVSAGDYLQVRTTPSGTPAAANCESSYVFVATTDGEFNIQINVSDFLGNGNNKYAPLGRPTLAWSNTEAESGAPIATEFTFKHLRVVLGGNVGDATFTLMKSNVATSIAATCTGTSSANDLTNSAVFATTDTVALKETGTSFGFLEVMQGITTIGVDVGTLTAAVGYRSATWRFL